MKHSTVIPEVGSSYGDGWSSSTAGPEAMAELLNDLGVRGRPGSIEAAAHASKLVVMGSGSACAAGTGPPAIPGGRRSPSPWATRHAGAILAGVIDELGFDPVDKGAVGGAGGRRRLGSPVRIVPVTADGVSERLGAMA
jgi:hypothetical protein